MRVEMTRYATKQLSDHITTGEAQPSPEYKDVWYFVCEELSIQWDDPDADSNVRVRLQLDGIWGKTDEIGKEMLQCVLDLVRTDISSKNEQREQRRIRQTTERRPRFTVTNVDFASALNFRLDMAGLRMLHELGRLGISLAQLPVLMLQPTPEELPEFVQALRDLVGLDDDRIAGVSTICVDDRYSSWPVIRAVLTAAQHSSKLRAIELDVGENEGDVDYRDYVAGLNREEEDDEDDDEDEDEAFDSERVAVDQEDDQEEEGSEDAEDGEENDEDDQDEDDEDEDEEEDDLDELDRLDDHDFDRSELWQWIAFTLFSRHADHNIETLELNSETLEESEVEAIRRVLNAPNPYAVVRGRPGVLPRQFVPRQIVTSRFVLQDPAEDGVGPPFVGKNPIAVRVLETPDKRVFPWYQVLLPGYGDAFVHEDDVVSKSEEDLRLNNRQVTPLPQFLRIDIGNMTDDSMDPVADLGLIGQETRRIIYSEHLGDRDFEGWCARVLTLCPKLEELDVFGGFVDDLNVFEASARAGNCRLRELRVSFATTGDKAQNVRRLFDALCDSTHPLTGHLRHLSVGLIVETENPNDVVEPVLRLLTQNRRLVEIGLTLKFPEAIEPHRPEFESALDNRPSDTLVIRTGPLDLRCKLAFLSAVDHEARVYGRALGQLDSSVLAIVLQFAAEGRRRSCTVFYEEFPRRFF